MSLVIALILGYWLSDINCNPERQSKDFTAQPRVRDRAPGAECMNQNEIDEGRWQPVNQCYYREGNWLRWGSILLCAIIWTRRWWGITSLITAFCLISRAFPLPTILRRSCYHAFISLFSGTIRTTRLHTSPIKCRAIASILHYLTLIIFNDFQKAAALVLNINKSISNTKSNSTMGDHQCRRLYFLGFFPTII